jgi:VanZ family protein
MKIKYFWKPILWLALICYGLFIPAKELPLRPFLNIPHFDKMVHFSLFFGLCILLFNPFKKINLKYYFFAPATSLFLGAILELSQHFISRSRHTDLYDFIANSAGILAALVFYYLFVSGKKWEKLF